MKGLHAWLLGLLTVLALGCTELLAPGFPHRKHLTGDQCGGLDEPPCPTCVTCHENIRRDEDPPRGDKELCRRCHGDATDTVFASVRPWSHKRTEIIFSHETHLGLDALVGQCIPCHPGITDDGVEGGVFPAMDGCIGCHDDGLRADQCSSCHRPRDLRRLVPETFLRHDGAFFRNHGMIASRHEGVCATCHAESDCVRCHSQGQPIGLKTLLPESIDRNLIHRGDFVARHAIEARSQAGQCARCHTPSFCDSCHLERGVSGQRRGAINPHPIGWVGPDAGGRHHHGRAARRDITSCAACHDAGPATNCIRCHRVGGAGGNPHPAGWRSLRTPNAPMCRYCHVP